MHRVVKEPLLRWRSPIGLGGAVKTLFGAAVVVAAGSASGADLSEVYAQAVANDPVLAAARASHQSRQQGVPMARAGLLPSVGANASASRSTVSTDGTDLNQSSSNFGRPFLDREVERRSWGAGVNQTVLDLPAWFSYRSAKARALQADWDLEATTQGLITRVATAYLNVLRGEAALASVVASEEAVQRQLEQVQQRFDVGLVAITDVLEAKAAYDNEVVSRIQAEGNHDIFFEGLRTLTASQVTAVDSLNESLPIVDPVPADENEWVEMALARNFLIQSARQALKAAERDLRGQLAAHLPTVTASANYGASNGSQAFGSFVIPAQSSAQISYSLSVNMPIYQGRIHAGVHQARHGLDQARQQLIGEELTAARDVRNLYRAVVTEVVRVAARAEAIKSSQSALEATQTGYEVGTRNIVDVLLAQRRLFSSQYDYATSRYDYVINLLRLKEAAGVLASADIDELNRFTDAANPIVPFSMR